MTANVCDLAGIKQAFEQLNKKYEAARLALANEQEAAEFEAMETIDLLRKFEEIGNLRGRAERGQLSTSDLLSIALDLHEMLKAYEEKLTRETERRYWENPESYEAAEKALEGDDDDSAAA